MHEIIRFFRFLRICHIISDKSPQQRIKKRKKRPDSRDMATARRISDEEYVAQQVAAMERKIDEHYAPDPFDPGTYDAYVAKLLSLEQPFIDTLVQLDRASNRIQLRMALLEMGVCYMPKAASGWWDTVASILRLVRSDLVRIEMPILSVQPELTTEWDRLWYGTRDKCAREPDIDAVLCLCAQQIARAESGTVWRQLGRNARFRVIRTHAEKQLKAAMAMTFELTNEFVQQVFSFMSYNSAIDTLIDDEVVTLDYVNNLTTRARARVAWMDQVKCRLVAQGYPMQHVHLDVTRGDNIRGFFDGLADSAGSHLVSLKITGLLPAE